jgi:hypothetical protein
MVSNQSQRPRFFENQYLGAADLTEIVDYERIQQARHILGAHTWGIAIGLQLKSKAAPGGQLDMYIQPGYAWDGFGRAIVVLTPYKIPPTLFQSFLDDSSPDGQQVPVWLRYASSETRAPRQGFGVCDPQDQNSRIQESFQIEVGDRIRIDQHDGVVLAGLSTDPLLAFRRFDSSDPLLYDESVPFQTFPDEAVKARWLIPLGVVRWLPNSNTTLPGQFGSLQDKDRARSRELRRYIGVVAEAMQAPDGRLRLQDRSRDPTSFAPPSSDLVWIEGDLRIEGNARLFGRRLEFRDQSGDDHNIPLTLRRDSFQSVGSPGGGTPQTISELQAIIGNSDDANLGNNRFAVGPLQKATSAGGKDILQEKLIVRADGKVGIGSPAPRNPLAVRAMGDAQELISFEDPTGQTKWHINQNFGGNPGLNFAETGVADGRLFLRAGGGTVGINTTQPSNTLHVNGNTGIRQNRLYLSGGDGWSSLTYNAHHDNTNGSWIFPDPTRPAVTIDIDDNRGTFPRFEVWSTTSAATTGWIQRLAINGNTGNVALAHNGGSVGIGTNSPNDRLDVRGNIRLGDGTLFAPASAENLAIIRGTVFRDASTFIQIGVGFQVTRASTGLYTITFNTPFPSPPSCSVTQVFPNDINSGGGSTIDNAVIVGIQQDRMRIKTGDGLGNASDRRFSFIVIGPR